MWRAQLGGFLARKGDGSPGITHIWRGLTKLAGMMVGMRIYRHIFGQLKGGEDRRETGSYRLYLLVPIKVKITAFRRSGLSMN